MGDETFSVENLARDVAMSYSQLHRKLTALLNQSPNHVIRSIRLQRAKDLIERDAGTISEIAYTVGFGSPAYLTKCFHEQFGIVPSQLKRRSGATSPDTSGSPGS
jgi:transcriptional regulator GlxA family with amidase domain